MDKLMKITAQERRDILFLDELHSRNRNACIDRRPSAIAISCWIGMISFIMSALSCHAGTGRVPYEERADIMGTVFTITIDSPGNHKQATRAAFEEIRRLDRQMSTYKEESEISEVNRQAGKKPVSVGPDFWNVVTACRLYFDLSEGSFDPTVYPLMRMWGFTRHEGRLPTSDEIRKTVPLLGFGKVGLDESMRTVGFQREGMGLDFGGIAKGYAVDRAIDVLRQFGITSAIIDAGGNFYALGTPAGRAYWRAGIRHPLRLEEVIARLPVTGKGVSTSGNYERFFEIGGRKYCHIMDPRTGWPVEGMLSATVIADTATAADALSTAVFVLGEEKGMQLIEQLPNVEGILIIPEKGSLEKFRVLISSGLKDILELLVPAAS
ncbi:FAD:protein FMN transferase [Candidatus Poribacteria bacterium]|nr:FAD:protein FMN transferase [Candidatus Poribacteria bacterium]